MPSFLSNGYGVSAPEVEATYKTDGRQLERVGVTYVLHRTESGWKFTTLVLHDPEKSPALSSQHSAELSNYAISRSGAQAAVRFTFPPE